MQPHVKIAYEEGTEAVAPLNGQATSFGSSFDCDVVLLADDVSDVAFRVLSEKTKTILVATAEQNIELHREEALVPLVDGGETLIIEGDVIKLGSVSLEFWDIACGKHQNLLPAFLGVTRLPARAAIITAGSFCLCGAAYATYQTIDFNASQTERMAMASTISSPEKSGQEMIESEAMQGTTMTATTAATQIYVQSDAAKLELMMQNPAGNAQIFVDQNIRRAVKVALSMSGFETGDVSVSNGNIEIFDAPSDSGWREAFISAMKSDVPGLKSIEFSGAHRGWEMAVEQRVVGVWAGENPYLILTEGAKVHRNQELMEGVRFTNVISSNLLVFSINGEKKEFRLP